MPYMVISLKEHEFLNKLRDKYSSELYQDTKGRDGTGLPYVKSMSMTPYLVHSSPLVNSNSDNLIMELKHPQIEDYGGMRIAEIFEGYKQTVDPADKLISQNMMHSKRKFLHIVDDIN